MTMYCFWGLSLGTQVCPEETRRTCESLLKEAKGAQGCPLKEVRGTQVGPGEAREGLQKGPGKARGVFLRTT